MTIKALSRRKRPVQRFRLSLMRWIRLTFVSTILISILVLVSAGWRSVKVEFAIEQLRKEIPGPQPWQRFPVLEGYYGGFRDLVPRNIDIVEYPTDEYDSASASNQGNASHRATAISQSQPFNPYPEYTSSDYTSKYGAKVNCFLDAESRLKMPSTRAYTGVPRGFPDPIIGSNTLLGINDDVCFDRFGRLGPYGLGYSVDRGGSGAQLKGDRAGADDIWMSDPQVDFRRVRWREVQERCVLANKHRFKELPSPLIDNFRALSFDGLFERNSSMADHARADKSESLPASIEKIPRTAVLIRTWWDYQYKSEDLINLRSIISELTLASGGEYIVYFLVHVKDDNAPIWSDDETYKRVLRDSLPEEFRGMGILWSERQMGLIYGGLEETHRLGPPVHGAYRGLFMPVQYFAHQHPEYDYFWNWEMDIRYTGHWYHLFDSVTKWARKQPRKGLWERNGRFYVPAKYGTWEDFRQMVRINTEEGTKSPNNLWSGLPGAGNGMTMDKTIWGPERPSDDIAFKDDPIPPTTYEKDEYIWGVGEEADLITFNPIFDPDGTTWFHTQDFSGYGQTRGSPPRRAAVIAASRLSRKLLMMMHRETALKRHSMFSEMWPASCALHHGLKAVYAPHSEYIDRKWPVTYFENVFNGGRNGASGGGLKSVFGYRQHSFHGTTWYYNATFPEVLWKRWLGYKFNGDGGEQFELSREGRMCLPPMLLHPIKRVDLVIEGLRDG